MAIFFVKLAVENTIRVSIEIKGLGALTYDSGRDLRGDSTALYADGLAALALEGSNDGPLLDPIPRKLPLLEQSYAQLKEWVYGGLMLQTRLKPYMDAITLSIDVKGIKLDFSAMEAANDFEWRATA